MCSKTSGPYPDFRVLVGGGGGHNQARGEGGGLGPLVCPGQSPGRGFRGRRPPTENDFQCFRMAWKALPYTIL